MNIGLILSHSPSSSRLAAEHCSDYFQRSMRAAKPAIEVAFFEGKSHMPTATAPGAEGAVYLDPSLMCMVMALLDERYAVIAT